MAAVVHVIGRQSAGASSREPLHHLVTLLIAVVAVLNAAHIVEVAIWGVVYDAFNVIPETVDPFYLAFVNFTTLGYGDVVPLPEWRLIGPMTAMNGVLLLGWSTAVIFAVLSEQGYLARRLNRTA
jgi:hypothetical protein